VEVDVDDDDKTATTTQTRGGKFCIGACSTVIPKLFQLQTSSSAFEFEII